MSYGYSVGFDCTGRSARNDTNIKAGFFQGELILASIAANVATGNRDRMSNEAANWRYIFGRQRTDSFLRS